MFPIYLYNGTFTGCPICMAAGEELYLSIVLHETSGC